MRRPPQQLPRPLVLSALLALVGTTLCVGVHAQTALPEDEGVATNRRVVHALELRPASSNISHDLGLTWQAAFGSSWRLRVQLASGRIAFDTIGGFAVDDGWGHLLRVGPRAVVARSGPLALSLHFDAVARMLRADDELQLQDKTATIAGVDVGIVGDVRLSDTWAMQLGFRVPFEMELDPIVTTHRLGPLTTLEASWAATDWMRLVAHATAGGQFGSDGDGLKMEAGGGLALRFYPGRHARSSWIY